MRSYTVQGHGLPCMASRDLQQEHQLLQGSQALDTPSRCPGLPCRRSKAALGR